MPMTSQLSTALFREVRPEFFRVLSGAAARLYVDALEALERAALEQVQGVEREDALGLIEQAVEQHAEVAIEEAGGTARERARAVLDALRRAGWLEEEERSDWRKLVHFHASGLEMMRTLRKLAFPEAVVFSDKLVRYNVRFVSETHAARGKRAFEKVEVFE